MYAEGCECICICVRGVYVLKGVSVYACVTYIHICMYVKGCECMWVC